MPPVFPFHYFPAVTAKTFIANTVKILVASGLLLYFLTPLSGLVFITPASHMTIFAVGCKSYAEVIVVCIAAIGIVIYQFWHVPVTKRRFDILILIACWFAVIIITALKWRYDHLTSNYAVMTIIAYSAGLLVARLVNKTQVLILLLTAVSAFEAGLTIYQHHIEGSTPVLNAVNGVGNTEGATQGLRVLFLVVIPPSLIAAVNAKQSMMALFWMICSAAMFAALVVLHTFGSLVALALALVWTYGRSVTWNRSSLAVSLLMVCMLFIVFYLQTPRALNAASVVASVGGYTAPWQRGVNMFRNHWLSGMGIGALTVPIEVALPVGTTPAVNVYVEPNNVFLHWLDELGLAGGILFFLLSAAIRNIVYQSRSQDTIGIGAGWLAIFVLGIFETAFGPPSQICPNVLIGILLGSTILVASDSGV